MEKMIHVKRALELIDGCISPLEPVIVELSEAQGLVLAEDLFSQYNIPAYPQSSMDGYAFAFEEGKMMYVLEGEMAAGSNHQFQLKPGCAVRIFTGAKRVIMCEKLGRKYNMAQRHCLADIC
jgi:molybdopterin molybdotransferase